MSEIILQFVPFQSAVDTAFWYHLTKKKLDVYMLDDKPVDICGYYSNRGITGLPPLANVDYTSFDEDLQVPPHCFPLKGVLINTNTLNDFKIKDKAALIKHYGHKLWDVLKSGEALQEPSKLQTLICLTFADLKKYHYYYWFAFPAFDYSKPLKIGETRKLNSYFSQEQIEQLITSYNSLTTTHKTGFMVFISEANEIFAFPLKDYENWKNKPGKVLIAFADPSTLVDHPGWPLRNLLSLVAYHWGQEKTNWDVICFRMLYKDGKQHCEHSLVISIQISIETMNEYPNVVGWEKNKKTLAPKKVDMSLDMDPTKLAEAAIDLNLKLMRWRLVPELQLDDIKSTKCLLFGAGTLGCNVARCLLGWGIKKITFVDNSYISYSNPVRQTLFNFEDCLNGGKTKALAAAEALKAIFPNADSQGIFLNVPMPGHALSKNTIEETRNDVLKIEELIDSHDVIFLLMDTRESRWLPSVIGAAKGKIVLNAALGFDTFLVMRHGMKDKNSIASGDHLFPKIIAGSDLGCYFCNDVVAPGNSTQDRTLDQQCTVARPGISYMASAIIVELMVNILQHPQRALAPAEIKGIGDTAYYESTTVLGIVPHQIRGYIDKFQNSLLTSKAFNQCIACSSKVLNKYKTDGFNFLLQVFTDSDYLEELTGLKDLLNDTAIEDVIELSDAESA